MSPLDLAVYIYATLKGTHLADKKSALLSCFLALGTKFAVMSRCSYDDWTTLTTLLMEQPTFKDLADFLKNNNHSEVDDADEQFLYKTWTQLAQIFNQPHALSELALNHLLLRDIVEPWIDLPRRSDATVVSLVFTYSICSNSLPKTWAIETLCQQNETQEFFLQAITKSQYNDMQVRLLTTFKTFIDVDSWSFAQQLSWRSLEYLAAILLSNKDTPVDPTLCLAILDNQQASSDIKLSITSHVLKTTRECDISILSQILSKLTSPNSFSIPTCSKILSSPLLYNIYEYSLATQWTSSCIEFSYETDDLLAQYTNAATEQLESFDKLTVILHGKKTSLCQSKLDTIATKFITATLCNLQQFSIQNKAKLETISPRSVPSRISAAITIKDAAIRLIFTIYSRITDPTVKNRVYDKLKEALPKIDATADKSEFHVAELCANDGYKMLGFSYGTIETTFVIAPDMTPKSD